MKCPPSAADIQSSTGWENQKSTDSLKFGLWKELSMRQEVLTQVYFSKLLTVLYKLPFKQIFLQIEQQLFGLIGMVYDYDLGIFSKLTHLNGVQWPIDALKQAFYEQLLKEVI